MAGINAHGATFTFNSVRATVVGIQVETPVAEVVDMTTFSNGKSASVLVPTGGFTGGSISVDCLMTSVPSTATLGVVADAVFASPRFNYTRRCLLESASVEARTGDLVRGTFKFRLTDHTATG